MERPGSVIGQQLPAGPDVDDVRLQSVSGSDDLQSSTSSKGSVFAPGAQVPTQAKQQAPVEHPDQDKKVTIVNGQMVLRSTTASGDESIIVRPTTAGSRKAAPAPTDDFAPGSMAPRSSPTHSSMQEQLRFQQNEALKRLQELEQQMVGGENKENNELKERRKRRKQFADERKRKLAEAIANMDDDGIMLDIYDQMGDKQKATEKRLEKEKQKCEALNREILDLQSEFEFERIDYLDTIRKQEKELKLLQKIIDVIHPCLRKDCNYSNLDKIKMMSKWDDDEQKWIMPALKIEKTALPVTGTTLPTAMNGSRSPRMVNGDYDDFDDRFRHKIMRSEDKTGAYFQSKRPSQLVSEPLSKVDISEVKKSYNIQPQTTLPMSNGFMGRNSLVDMDEPMSSGLKAAKVHGTVLNDEGVVRKPARLQALGPVGKKEKKKKRNNYDDGY